MKQPEVESLAKEGMFQEAPLKGVLEETHISWVILSGKHAFKIKKPIQLPFLNFSTLSLRKHYCDQEVLLNSRFTDIYERVVPVRKQEGRWYLGNHKGVIADYAVQMKRLRHNKRLDILLARGDVQQERIVALAREIADFHHGAEKVFVPFDLRAARETFNELGTIREFVTVELGATYTEDISRAMAWSDAFLAEHADRLQERVRLGLQRDVHGDLHSGNVFLYRQPVLFDCIEFNDSYRRIDVLYEVAFLCMDFERFQHKHLATLFLDTYARHSNSMGHPADTVIFNYFKCLRANVRAKVHALRAIQVVNDQEKRAETDHIRNYLSLMTQYIRESDRLDPLPMG